MGFPSGMDLKRTCELRLDSDTKAAVTVFQDGSTRSALARICSAAPIADRIALTDSNSQRKRCAASARDQAVARHCS
jgi:hypothetical protein